MWLLYAILSAFTAALVAIFGKIGLKNVDVTVATTIRAAIMFLMMLLATIALGKTSALFAHSRGLFWIITSGIAGGLSWLFYFLALKHGTATGATAVDRLSIVFVVILAALFLGEKFTLMTVLGVALMAAGAVLLAL